MALPYHISAAQLMRQIGLPDAPLLLDVRIAEDIADHPFAVPTSLMRGHLDVAQDDAPPQDARVVVICQKGRKLSEGVAALLRLRGCDAMVLTGGTQAWAEAGLPMTALAARPASRLWVTRARPKIDRIACPWLIRRFVDPAAQFLFVAAGEVAVVAEKFGATPFDIEGVALTHRGDMCSFDAMIADFGLGTPALDRLAVIVRAADTNRGDLAPEAAGLLALSVGLSRQYRDDLAQLQAGMAIYDALYRWARDGQGEGHDWLEGAAN